MTETYAKLVRRYVTLAKRHTLALLLAFMLISVVGVWLAMARISIDTDLAALLPEGTDSVRALELSETRIGAIDFFTYAIESKNKDVDAIVRMQDLLKQRIEAEWKDATWIQISRDTDFFKKHALYYLDVKELKRLRFALEDELAQASADRMPGFVNLLDDDDEDMGIAGWYNPDIPWRMGLPSQVRRSFDNFFKDVSADGDGNKPGLRDEKHLKRLISMDGEVGVVLVQLSQPSTDIDYCKHALFRGNALIADIDIASIDPSMSVEVVGAYRKFMEVESIGKDGKTATIISVILVLVLLLLFFRSGRTVFVIFGPLFVATSVTMGIVALTYERLTVLTVFILALLIGMGIDYGIHLFGRIKDELARGASLSDAMVTALAETGRALMAAAATTIASMLVLLAGHFEGFREFGVVAAFGLMVCVVAAILVIPPLIFFIQRIKPIHIRNMRDENDPRRPGILFGMNIKKLALLSFEVTLLMVIGLAYFAPDTQFEYDIRRIMDPRTRPSIDYLRALGKDSGTAPAVVLGKSREQMQQVHDYLLKALVKDKDDSIMSFITYYTFVPAHERQLARQKEIRKIGRLVKKKALQDLDGRKGELIGELTAMTEALPFDHTDLPDWARRVVTEANGEIGRIGHIYGNFDEWNVYSGREFQERFGDLSFDGSWLPIACSRFILSDVVRMVKSDGLRLLIVVAVVLWLILMVFTRRLRSTAILFFVLALGGVWTAGLMGLLDVRISLYNVIVIPVILGVGIDGAIHLYHRYHATQGKDIAEVLRTSGVTVSASSITTMAGFMGLLFVEHKGLQTIGQLGVIGITTSWLAVMLLLPYLLKYTDCKKEK